MAVSCWDMSMSRQLEADGFNGKLLVDYHILICRAPVSEEWGLLLPQMRL